MVEDLRLIRFWLRELSRIHFSLGKTKSVYFLNPAFVANLFPNDEINFLSFDKLTIGLIHNNTMFPGLTALTRSHILRCNFLHLDGGFKTLFDELLLASKHRVSKVVEVLLNCNIEDLTKVKVKMDTQIFY
jgi:hypothetical protein